VKPYQISGPAWLDCCSDRFTIVAKVPEGATKEQVNLMWQNLLKDRFGVVIHHESRVFQGEELTLPKGPSKLKETAMGRDPVLDRYYKATSGVCSTVQGLAICLPKRSRSSRWRACSTNWPGIR